VLLSSAWFPSSTSQQWTSEDPQEEQKSLLAKLNGALEKLGAKRPHLYNTYWSSDQWMFAGVEEFPNIEAVQKYMAALQELNWNRYVESTNVLGTKKLEP
jgi:hypothetical protein